MRAQENFVGSGMLFAGLVAIAIIVMIFLLIFAQRLFGVSL